MEYAEQLNENRQKAKLSFYQNPGYQIERRERKTFIIKLEGSTVVSGSTLETGEFDVKLMEPLIIDRLSDIYLENFTTFHNAAQTNPGVEDERMAFVLKIDQFNHQGNSTNSKLFNSIMIPNEISVSSTGAVRKVHKGKKLNYICSINPKNIYQLSGSITDLDGASTMFGARDMVIMEFVIIARD